MIDGTDTYAYSNNDLFYDSESDQLYILLSNKFTFQEDQREENWQYDAYASLPSRQSNYEGNEDIDFEHHVYSNVIKMIADFDQDENYRYEFLNCCTELQ